MEFNVTDTSLAFSDVVGPSHVSGLESFSDFEIGSEYESFEDHEAHDSGVEEESVTPQAVESIQGGNKDTKDESFSFGVNRLPSGDIREFLNALESAKAQLGMAISSQDPGSPVQDESSLGILNLDSTQETSTFNQSSPDALVLQAQTPSYNDTNNISNEKLPFDGEYNSPLTLSHLQEDSFNEPEKQENPSSQEPPSKENVVTDKSAISSLQLSQDELQMYMLQTTRASSGDGGELIDRVSMASSISFLQSQTFPESLMSSSYTRGSGSGTDSGQSDTNKDEQDDNDDNDDDDNDHTLSLIHDAGDGSNGASSISVGRPGLEGANSEPEDGYTLSGASSDIVGSGSIEIRQSGEGGDVLPDLPGDGGGGGDGSSGHESDDNQPVASGDSVSSTRSSSRSSVSSCSDQYVPVAVPNSQSSSSNALDVAHGRGPPVGHAAADGSPPLIPNSQRLSGIFSNNSIDQFDGLAASTPLIRPGKNAFQFDGLTPAEVSAISSQYLLATQSASHRPGLRVSESSIAHAQDGSFHLSQVLEATGNREELDNTLTNAPSLNFEAQGMTPRPQFYNQSGFDNNKTLTVKTPVSSDSKTKDVKAFSVDVNNSFGFQEGASGDGGENSLLWKSTPREEEEAFRSTPGIVFDGNDRPSPVPNEQDSLKVDVNMIQGGRVDQNSQGRNAQDETLKRLQTPGGSEEQTIPFSNWSQNPPSQALGEHFNPFESDGSIQQSINWNESQDNDFVCGGDAKSLLAADEKSFEKEHQFDVPITPNDVISGQDWTIASTGHSTRRSQVVGINDPDNEGEVRISFGAFIAAASEELGALSGSDPNRPRPHFGDGTISTPSPRAPIRLVDLTSSDDIFGQTAEDFSMYQKSLFQQSNISNEPKTVRKLSKGHTNKKGCIDTSKQKTESEPEARKKILDEQYRNQRPDADRERRGSQSSNHSSHSSGSKSSANSVTKKNKKDQATKSRKTSTESKQETKQRRQQQRTHREPDGCSSKENAAKLTRVPQPGSLTNALRDKKNIVDTKNTQPVTKKDCHMEYKTAKRTKSEGQNSDGDVPRPARAISRSSSDDSTTSSLLTSGSGGISFKNQQELAEFIARAVNVSPEHLGNLLHAVADAKTKGHHSSKTTTHATPDKSVTQGRTQDEANSAEELETSTQSPELEKLRTMKPMASSSPNDRLAACTSVTTALSVDDSPTSIYSMSQSSVFVSSCNDASLMDKDSPDNVSVIENTTITSPAMDKLPSPPPNPFSNAHIQPTFGKTYTVKDKKMDVEDVKQPQKLDLDDKTLSTDFHPVGSVSICSAGSDLTLQESIHDRSYTSGMYSKSPDMDKTGRHSWPKTYTNSPYKSPGPSLPTYHGNIAAQQPLPVQNSDYSRPITIGVPAQNMTNQPFPGISPQFPGQTGTFGYHQGLGPHSTGMPGSAPLSGTFPMPYQPQSQTLQQNQLGTLLGQAHNNMNQGQYPSNMFPHDGFSVPGYMGPAGTISISQQQVPQNYGFFTSNQPQQPNTVSSGLGTRLATAAQAVQWQNHNLQMPDHYATAPHMGLLQLGQPSHGQRNKDPLMPSGPHTKMASSLTPVVIPGEVKLPPVCPVGVSTRTILTLHNSSSKWIYCMVKVAYCTVNGAQVANSVNNPFFVPSKLIINPHTTIPIEIIFKPNLPGLHTAQLHITSSPAASEGQQTYESLPSLVALEAVGEQPDIEILSEDSQVVDFGEMVTNSRHSRPLRLINKGKASIPIRLTITPNATSFHCFSFSNADASPTKGSSAKTAVKGFLSTHKLVLKGNQLMNAANEPQVTWIVFQAPQKSDSGNATVGIPDEFTARVDIEIDSEEGPIIGSVLLKASVGVARLHTPKSLEALTLSGVVGQRISRAFPLRNAGNITLQVDLKVSNNNEYFTVIPARTVLRPQQEEEITVQFKPTKADCVIDSALVMSVLPDGPVYDLLLRGMATSDKDITKKESELLLCNKPVVCWGGVAVGNAVQQKVVLKHNGSPSSKKLKLQLSVQHPDFQLQNTFGRVDEKSMASIVNLAPQEELPVHILFAPSTLGLISSALVIRNNKTKSKVPLYGCGGSSELVLVDTRKLSEGYIANLGEVFLGKKNVVKVTIKNTGSRPAFVKAVCYSDVAAQTVYPASHLSIAPNNFVLPERTSKQVVVVYQPLENDALKCKNEMSTVATIAFYTGDEGIRQQYKRYVQRNDIPLTAAQCKGPLTNINFLTAFQDEDKVIDDVIYPQVPNWAQFFQSCVSRVLLMLIGSPPTVQDKDRSLDLVPMPGPSENGPSQLIRKAISTVSEPPSVTRKVSPPITTSQEVNEVHKLEAWTVLPEQLVLTADKNFSEKGTGRIQIVNFSDRPLPFEFIWPAQYLTITPDSGLIPARSQVMVVMSPKPTLHSSGIALPWGGTVYIKCDDTQKAVRVQIREEVVLENSPYQPGAVTLQALESKEGEATPFTPALPTNHLAPLVIKKKQIQFQDTVSGKESVMELVMENTSLSSVMWDLSSVAPAYIKASDNAGDLYRATYTAFSFHKRSGSAASKAIIRIPVHFQPRDPGRYSQFWDLQFQQEGTRRVHKRKIELIGQALPKAVVRHQPTRQQLKDPQSHVVDTEDHKVTKHQDTTDRNSNKFTGKPGMKPKGMYLAESVITFPVTLPGHSSVMKVKICNASADECTVKVTIPKGPFSSTHEEVLLKPRHYVRIPVKFTPPEPNTNYEVVVLFTSKTGVTQNVTLHGASSDSVL